MEILCFYAGIAFIYIHKCYALLFIFILLYFRPKPIYVVWFLAAIAWGVVHQWWISPRAMPTDSVIQKAELIGQVSSIPVINGDTVQFSFAVTRLNGKEVKTNIALACYSHCPELHTGQYWHVIAKLKKPRNLGNPGAFDYVGWLNARHIHWSGNVRSGSFQLISAKHQAISLLQIREYLCNKIASLDKDEQTLGIIQALTLGANTHISKSEWDLFRHTGTTHLIDISGAHIGLIAGITFYVIGWVWSRMGTLSLYWPAPKTASIVALFMAFTYTLLSGFAIPAQRAFLASSFMLLRYFCNQRFSVWQAWRYALLAVLVFEPHSVLSAGFYLSFIGVAILVVVNQRVSFSGMRKRLSLQLACITGMMPLTLFWFSYDAVNGIVANIFAIPWVELWIVPLGLLITLLPQCTLTQGMMLVLKSSVSLLLFFLNWVDSFSVLNLTFSFHHIASPLALMLALSVILFLPIRGLILPVGIMVLAAIIPYQLQIKPGTARIDVLDVGQGLSVAIHTAHHTLLYDTGVKFFQGSDMGKIAIIPYLKTLGVKKIDKIVISHPDLDHRGGLQSIEESFPVQELIVDDPEFYHRGSPCHAYPSWTWDGISFRFFPLNNLPSKKNNHSCILQLSTRSGEVLLTGDIEKEGEAYLVSKYGHDLASTFMVIPHHASKTSSTSSFVEQVSPEYAIVSYGFDNRYHFPHQQALQSYQQRKIPILNTVDCGMVTIKLDDTANRYKPKCYIE